LPKENPNWICSSFRCSIWSLESRNIQSDICCQRNLLSMSYYLLLLIFFVC